MTDIIKRDDFKKWISDLKSHIRKAQLKAAVKVNSELLQLYWDMGKEIVERQIEATYGSGFFEKLSKELMTEFPHMKGFSVTNLKYCKRFYLLYNNCNTNRPQAVDDFNYLFLIPWGHQRYIIDISAVNHQMRKPTDNKTIGLLICKSKDNIMAQYSLESSNQPIGISSYELSKLMPDNLKSQLPSIEEIEASLKETEIN